MKRIGVDVNSKRDPIASTMFWDNFVYWERRYGWERRIMEAAILVHLKDGTYSPLLGFTINEVIRAKINQTTWGIVENLIQRGDLPPDVRERWQADAVQDCDAINLVVRCLDPRGQEE